MCNSDFHIIIGIMLEIVSYDLIEFINKNILSMRAGKIIET